MASAGERPCSDIITTAVVPPSPIMAPSDRSKSPMTSTTVSPKAAIVWGAICRSIVSRLVTLKKVSGRAREKIANAATSASGSISA